MNELEFRALLHRYQEGKCTPAEKRRIEHWYAGLGAENASLQLTPSEQVALTDSVWQRIHQPLVPTFAEAPLASAGHRAWPRSVRWAAVALLAVGLGAVGGQLAHRSLRLDAIWQPRTAAASSATEWLVYANTTSHAARVALPDGSAVTLAPASSLEYPRIFRGPRRLVCLTGEAFFDVFHDKKHPFSVFTERVVTTVLGTSFRVQAYVGQPEVQVQVRTGAVRVSSRTTSVQHAAASVVVLPNQQAVYSAAHRQLRRELVAQPVLLVPQAFVFRDRPVAEVLAALSKAYNVEIVYDEAALHNCTLNLSLGSEPLFDKLNIICETLGATYEKADGRILFHSQPCLAE